MKNLKEFKKLVTELHELSRQKLTKTFTLEQKNIEIEEQFTKIAKYLINCLYININGNKYRLIDIEFYLFSKNHKDIYTHCDKQQIEFGKWYFHGSGIDLTIGNKTNAFGGILIRGIIPLVDFEKGKGIYGPIKCKTEICSKFNMAFDEKPNVFCFQKMENEIIVKYIVKTSRINLKQEKDIEGNFKNADYRFVVVQLNLGFENRTQIAKNLVNQFPDIKDDEIKKIFTYDILKGYKR